MNTRRSGGTLALIVAMLAFPAAPGQAAPPAAPALVAPSGLLAGTTHAFTWGAVAGATWYRLWLNDATAAPALSRWYTAEQANCAEGTGTCAVLLSTGLAAGPGRWFVAAWNPEGTAWSAGMDFTLSYVAGGWTWRRTAGRFQLVLGGAAVLDRATGLVWERDLSGLLTGWADAFRLCAQRRAAGRKGWRLPTIEELGSLSEAVWTLPAGHPFTGVADGWYWGATTDPTASASGYAINFVQGNWRDQAKTTLSGAWCVRGGRGPDGVQ